MRLLKLFFLVILISTFFIASILAGKPPRKVILMIGDGMGLAQLYAAQSIAKDNLNIFTCKSIGLVKTHSANNYVTDSAAGGTAYGIGKKTNNGVIGLDSELKLHPNLVELAEIKGLATGIVVTSPITHATPASFVAHNRSRKNDEEIALDILKLDIEVLIGGGRKDFNQRKDKLNLLDSLTSKGYQVLNEGESLKNADSSKLAALVYPSDPPRYSKGRSDFLPEGTQKAISILNQDTDGFFLMVEGSQIDWGGHENNLDYVIEEVLDFDKAVGKAIEFAKSDGQTLVIITADHETGGLTLNGFDEENGKPKVKWSSLDHTGICVPVYSYGPGSEEFMGLIDNTEIFEKIKKLLNL